MYFPIKLKHFKKSYINHTHIPKQLIEKLMRETADECPFSTFPYVFNMNSSQANRIHKTGNCITLSMYLKDKLSKHDIQSILIPATIPRMYSHPNYLNISHVALAILINLDEAYICDPAFYFKEPMKVSAINTQPSEIISQNIYQNLPEPLIYKTVFQPQQHILNPYQKIPANSFHVETFKKQDPTDIWKYYLMEILNPDQAISSFYISTKRLPFIACVNQSFQMTLYIKFIDQNTISIKNHNDTLYQGNIHEIPHDVLLIIQPCMIKHFGTSFNKYFNLPPDVNTKIYHIKDQPRTKKNKKKKTKKKYT